MGGKQFLDHVKLIMSKLNVGDWAAKSDEHGKIRIEELRDNLAIAVEAGAVVKPKNVEFVTFKVDDDQNLLLLDGNKVIEVAIKELVVNVSNYDDVINEYAKYDANVGEVVLEIACSLDDAGLILGKPETLRFLYEQFAVKIKRGHSNFVEWTNVFQLFLELVYWRRYHRVHEYIKDNTKKFEKLAKDNIDALLQQADLSLNKLRDLMRICKATCKTDKNENECYYLCLLRKNHKDAEDWEDMHC